MSNDEVRPNTACIPMGSEVLPVTRFTEEELEDTARRVNNDPRYGEEAQIISSCFRKFPKNEDADIIALKIALIDMTNSTNLNKHLRKVYLTSLIEKIKDCDFDKRVAIGDISLVAELAENKINLFSFFSKYCLYHNYYVYQNDDFAIFDGVMRKHIGGFISHYEYKGRVYMGAKLHNCIEKMRVTYDYEGYLSLIDSILEQNNIHIKCKRRKFDWFVWYNNK